MESLLLSLIVVPWVAGLLVLFSPRPAMRFLTGATVVGLSVLSFVMLFGLKEDLVLQLPSAMNLAVTVVDVALILYFLYVGINRRNWLVGLLAAAQGGLLAWLTAIAPHDVGPQIMVTKLSVFMYLLINVVSGVIAVYALRYIEDEDTTPQRRRMFMAIILGFIGVMNAIVSVDNIEWYFLLFEMTTLASFLLIRFRGCEASLRNSAQALWMNQVGGVAILVGLIVSVTTSQLHTVNFSQLVTATQQAHVLLPVALISIAALIKGAQLPFSNWLMGAMVAPTPVSALLHSSTMVKIGPYTILKLSPALAGTPVAWAIIVTGTLVFLLCSLMALAKDDFKLILANSTIALLGLMMAMAALGSSQAVTAALFLMLFHGVSKCLLFLNAGVLEKVFHLKKISQFNEFGAVGPLTALSITIGFMSLVLPPFGAFLGKWISVETMGAGMQGGSVVTIISLVSIVFGSAVMALLYLKVLGVIVQRSGRQEKLVWETMSPIYVYAPLTLVFILLLGAAGLPVLIEQLLMPAMVSATHATSIFTGSGMTLLFGSSSVSLWVILSSLVLLPGILIFASNFSFRGVDRTKEYSCGEKGELSFASYMFDFDRLYPAFIFIGILCFMSIIIAGRIAL